MNEIQQPILANQLETTHRLVVGEIRPVRDELGKVTGLVTFWVHIRECSQIDASSEVMEGTMSSISMKADMLGAELGACPACIARGLGT